MGHILYKKDSRGLYLIPVNCERLSWKTCPEHKNLSPQQDAPPAYNTNFASSVPSDSLSFDSYNAADYMIGGFDYRELINGGMTMDEVIQLRTMPPQGNRLAHSWSNVVVQQVDDKGLHAVRDGITPDFVIAEALNKENEVMNRQKYANLSDDNNVRLTTLQDGGDRYYSLATIVMEDKDGVFNSDAKKAAEAVQKRSNYMGRKWGTPLTKDASTGLWEVDPCVSELAYHVDASLRNIPEGKKAERSKAVNYFDDKSLAYNAYESKGSPSTRSYPDFNTNSGNIQFQKQAPAPNTKKPSDILVGLRLRKRLLEIQLNNLARNEPKGVKALFLGRNAKKQRDMVAAQLNTVANNLTAAENKAAMSS